MLIFVSAWLFDIVGQIHFLAILNVNISANQLLCYRVVKFLVDKSS